MDILSQEISATALPPAINTPSTTSLVLDAEAFASIEKFADMMATGKATVPTHLRGNKADCAAVTMQAMQWRLNPFAVAQKTHLVNGTLGYEAQLVAAVINTSGVTTGRLNSERFGPWEKVIGKFAIRKNAEGKEYRVPAWNMADEEGCGVRVWATIKGEDEPRVLELLLAQAGVRNSTLWGSDPVQQLIYLAEKRWGRLHAPDVLLGVYTPDELDPKHGGEKEINPVRPLSPNATAESARSKGMHSEQGGRLISELEAIAALGDMTALSQRWEAIGKAGRKAVGGEDWQRIKDLAESAAPVVVASNEEAGDHGGD